MNAEFWAVWDMAKDEHQLYGLHSSKEEAEEERDRWRKLLRKSRPGKAPKHEIAPIVLRDWQITAEERHLSYEWAKGNPT